MTETDSGQMFASVWDALGDTIANSTDVGGLKPEGRRVYSRTGDL